MTSRTLITLGLMATLAWGQASTSPPTPGLGPQAGFRLLSLTDLNGDGIPEYVVSRPTNSNAALHNGRVSVHDGVSDLQLWQRDGLNAFEYYGRNLGLADWNGDGQPDIVAAAQLTGSSAPRLEVLDALVGTVITTLTLPPGTSTAEVGDSIAGGDLDNDGLDEILVSTSPVGYQTYINVGTPGELLVFSPTAPTYFVTDTELDFGRELRVLEDLDGDGFRDILVTAPWADTVTGTTTIFRTGLVRAISSAGLGTLWELRGPVAGATLGMQLAMTPDLDNDGRRDIVALSLVAGPAGTPQKLMLISAGLGTILASPNLPTGAWVGQDLEVVPDLDGDGVSELALAGLQSVSPMYFVDLVSLTDFRHMDRLTGLDAVGAGASALAHMPDSNADGRPELLVGSGYGNSSQGAIVREELRPVLSALADGSPNHDLLRVNGSTQEPSRRLDLALGQAFSISVDPHPSLSTPTDFIIWGLVGVPNSTSAYPVTGGSFLFPPRIAAPGLPWLFCLTDSVGFDPAAAFPAGPAPWALGAPFGIPFPIDLTFQGVTIVGTTIEITNGVLLHVR